MGYFVKVENNIVTKVVMAEQSYIDSGAEGDPSLWKLSEGNCFPDYKRENDLGVGFSYDPATNRFIAPQPYPSWTYDNVTNQWSAPVAYPMDGQKYEWNELSQSWQLWNW